ncbi:MAG: aminodeoxyfutalosine deaminase [Gaiellaceae bacterium]|jgi:5-methylthioadenosine/S-adenosylhomocysteine deaminase|nr:aminodeoxyfutalosine deaminase [Gaiellaceae bacterium]
MKVLSADWVLPVEGPPIESGAVVIDDGRVVAVGKAEQLGEGTRYDDSVIVPGFVNAHSHLEYAVYGGFGDGLGDFAEWITLHIQRKARIGWDEHVDVARLGAAECLASGVTTVGDCSYSGATAVACAELGLRATVYLEVFGSDVPKALEHFARIRDRVGDAFSTRVKPGVSPHAPYSVSIELYAACAELGLPLATHISESPAEVAYLLSGSGAWGDYKDLLVASPGKTGTHLLAEHDLLGRNVVAAHGVVLDEDEIGLLASTGTGVAHCPRSNAALGCGVAPLTELRTAGVRVGVGTDSPASAPSFDFFEELRSVVLAARARAARPDVLSAGEALELGTLGSARALGLDAEIGSLAPGKRADLAVVSLEGSAYLPWEDPAGAVVFGGSPDRVIATYVDGEARYEKGGMDWHELTAAAHSARRAMLAQPAARPVAAAPRA